MKTSHLIDKSEFTVNALFTRARSMATKTRVLKPLFALGIALFLAGCVGTSTGRYDQRQDSAPNYVPVKLKHQEPIPEHVKYSEANSLPYTVFGQRYFPIPTGKYYEAEGVASWYGQKFHGHLTANGEVYNMYDLTAAHKTLPLPSFVKVTNTENSLSTIVRVNDRGPFHNDRLIDLSWAAAKKLDVLKTGTAKVKLEVIHVDEDGIVSIGKFKQPSTTPPLEPEENQTFIQVVALSNEEKANELAKGLALLYQLPTHIPENNGIFRLRLGPLTQGQDSEKLLDELKRNGFENAYKITGE